MPKVDKVGFGDCTEIKMGHFSRIIAMHLAVTRAVLTKNSHLYPQRYRYIDLTAGKGFSPNGEKGSPIAFIEQAEADKFEIPYRADFIECETSNIEELQSAIANEKQKNGWKTKNLHFYNGRY